MIRFLLKEQMAEKEFKEKRRITLNVISKETGIGRNTLSRIVSVDGHSTSTDVLDKLCNYFQCDISGIVKHIQDAD